MNPLKLTLLSLVATLLAAAPASPQQPGAALPADKVEIAYYVPIALGINEVQDTASQLFGGSIQLVSTFQAPDGTAAGRFETAYQQVPHFVLLGETLLIRDTAEQAAKIIATLKKLEQVEADRRAKLQADIEQTQRDYQKEMATRGVQAGAFDYKEFRPRYVDFKTLSSALNPFYREISIPQANGSTVKQSNISVVSESALLVVCESAERMKVIEQLVERIDRPQPQVTLSATLIRTADRDDANSGLPKELVDNLKQLVPFTRFEPVSVGVLRASLPSQKLCELHMDLADGAGNWTLMFRPQAWNPDTGEISLDDCRFRIVTAATPGQPEHSQEFTTALTFKTGEYTVLGGVGAKPIFVVLRAEVQKRSN